MARTPGGEDYQQATLCSEAGIALPDGQASIKEYIDRLNDYLLAAHARGRNTVLIIDEAQNLSVDVLEQLRLLTNLETNEKKLLQIVLIGQPELGDLLKRPELRQLSQRIIARYHLPPLSKTEVAAYVRHRLEVAGSTRELFPPSLMGKLHRVTGGIPRLINLVCDRALLGTYSQGRSSVNRATLTQAAQEVLHGPARTSPRRRVLAALLALLVISALPVYLWRIRSGQAAPAPAAASLPAASPVTPLADLDWPRNLAREQSRRMAFTALFRAWGLEAPGKNPCRQAARLTTICRSAQGGLEELRQLNRPAMLQFRDGPGETFYGTLGAVDDRTATVDLAGNSRTVSLETLAARWTGQYTLLWRKPPDGLDKLTPGQGGPAVQWLSRQLARAEGKADGANKAVFDDALVQRLRQFQLKQGLAPDGTLGLHTLMLLSGVGDTSAPTLMAMPGRK